MAVSAMPLLPHSTSYVLATPSPSRTNRGTYRESDDIIDDSAYLTKCTKDLEVVPLALGCPYQPPPPPPPRRTDVSSSCFSLAPPSPFSNVTLPPRPRTLAAKPQPDPTTSSAVSPAGNWGKQQTTLL
ncbi:uncharacterized protein BDZ83DRAFT_725388 [Colletotrichum acutatum]|uniref:Uncharacterized protein n=1 Tax=Glomerella acutata TaxID=27357 RepID=A0AAD8XQH3_GLOAC|nr:uncharacterized protein BDZ83DRAFT_725388 [Colletotrichum acutatum]KAK1731810.1 hypothetical protein BDZ83DRAFT_725388 [Colletotrichum acutatum]